MIFGGNVRDSIFNKSYIMQHVRLMRIATSSFKLTLNIFPFQRCNNWKIANHAGFVMAIKLLLSNFAILHQITSTTDLC